MTWGTKLPKKAGGRYLITYQGVVRQADFVEYPTGHFAWMVLPSCARVSINEVQAWMKQPEPYTGGQR
jgi:hypothetical protein